MVMFLRVQGWVASLQARDLGNMTCTSPSSVRDSLALALNLFLQHPVQANTWLIRVSLIHVMRCANGFVAKGFGDVRGFPFCGGKMGLRLPLAMGKGSETPSFLMLRREFQTLFTTARGSLRPFFPPQKGKPRTSPNPLSDKPLSATHDNIFWHS